MTDLYQVQQTRNALIETTAALNHVECDSPGVAQLADVVSMLVDAVQSLRAEVEELHGKLP